MVIKVNEVALQDKMGMTTHHPRWAIAYKFKARQATSTLLNIEFQVGRTGSITPVGKIKPVPIGGVTVSSFSLFNEEVIRDKDLMLDAHRPGSQFWNSIQKLKHLFRLGARHTMHNGKMTSFWRDWWQGSGPLCDRFPSLFSIVTE
jgi:hypothetical protein